MPSFRRFASFPRLSAYVAAGLLLAGCINDDLTQAERKAARTLQQMSSARAEYGSITMSQPLLIRPSGDTSPFAFEPALTARELFTAAQVDEEGAAMTAQSEQLAIALGLSGAADIPTINNFKTATDDFNRQRDSFARGQDLRREKLRVQYELARSEADNEKDPLAKKRLLAKARSDYLQGLTDLESATAGTPPVPDDSRVPTPSTATPTAKTDALLPIKGAGELIAGHTPKLPVRAALVTSSGDMAIQGIFQVLGDPEKYTKFQGKKIALAVATVSVEPGSRTREGYIGEVVVETYFHLDPARTELLEEIKKKQEATKTSAAGDLHASGQPESPPPPIPGAGSMESLMAQNINLERFMVASVSSISGKDSLRSLRGRLKSQPMVVAVSPLMDAQTMDLSSSYRQQYSFALQIAAALKGAGYNAGASIFSSWAKNLQSDFATKSNLPVTTTFNVGGGVFGFRVGPRLKALQSPGGRSTKPSSEIDRQSFPVLLVIGLETDDLRIQKSDSEFGVKAADGIYYSEPTLAFTQSGTWYAATPSLMPFVSHAFPTELDRLRWDRALYRLGVDSKKIQDEGSNPQPGGQQGPQGLGELTRHRAETMLLQVLGATSYASLPLDFFPLKEEPKPEIPAISAVAPATFKFDPTDKGRTHTLAIRGENLAKVSGVKLNGADATVLSAAKDAVLVEFALPDGFKGGSVNFAVSFKGQKNSLYTPTVKFEAWKQDDPPETITLGHTTRHVTNKADGGTEVTETFEVPTGSEALMEKYIESHKDSATDPARASTASVNLDIKAVQPGKP